MSSMLGVEGGEEKKTEYRRTSAHNNQSLHIKDTVPVVDDALATLRRRIDRVGPSGRAL